MTSQTDSIVIEPMATPADAQAFKDLNLEWITTIFTVEPADLATLDHPQRIVTDGGQVLIARDGADAVGCVALVAERPGVFELSKMAVTPRVRGRGVGRRLLAAALDRARRLGATEVFLASNSALVDAVHLYESVGFVHVPPAELPPFHYDRADVFMRYRL
ncbi:GNAT family N-acetyltransferase [Nocardia inohanensis]|uniref:GNAT family N-acetyltransferase n=1 Tax=Nocardia inohanensis TaxID=209246 RepID=UPI001C3FE7D7|nr:GNAT family N-acetyltransferase [Nocardia inohanensis]